MIETIRRKDGEILDKDGRRLEETAEIFRANQRRQTARVKDTKEYFAKEFESARKSSPDSEDQQDQLSQAYFDALSNYKAGLYDAHQHFIENGGNHGPYVDAALEDANAEMEKRGLAPINRYSETPKDEKDKLSPEDWSELGNQVAVTAPWIGKDPASEQYLHGVGIFLDDVKAIYAAETGGITPEEARLVAGSAMVAVIATKLWLEADGVVDPSAVSP